MFRRSRSFFGTVAVLCALIIFGYGLYMYDLQSMRLADVEASNRHLEREVKSLNKNIDKDEKKLTNLEESLKKEKHDLENIKGELKVESEQRQARENELVEMGVKFTTSSNENEQCHKEKAALEKSLEELKIEKNALAETVETYEEAAKKAQDEIASLNSDIDQLKSQVKAEAENVASQKETEALRAELDDNKAKYHATFNDLIELKEALHKLGVEGLRRDSHWMSVSSEERSLILEAILGTDIIPDSYLGAEEAPEGKISDNPQKESTENDSENAAAANPDEEEVVQVDAPSNDQLEQ
ncbi:Oidioi.mRNA.OKI2018_I69.XSR.g14935.t1.cds [Oikopleura dioica]|uniref:Oidioi.mRNA.OKI2018_I69.XSR.g14935.t1.cds n=1 Tax=Oikopleura dioica TaxID=34765 RepID=A0ABN7SIK1_OIKDI|nr:Oidioi.mRNA.OKI2018_I69.XSR.g14935.t1.cds [Oikopleura dioica]